MASERRNGRVLEDWLADLHAQADAERSSEDVQGRMICNYCHGVVLVTDKLRERVKKWQTLIEANIDVKTTDGYLLRVFCIGFTNKYSLGQESEICYADHNQVCAIRKKMCEIITREVTTSVLNDVVIKIFPNSIAKDIETACHDIYPLKNVSIRKVRVLERPRFEILKLMGLE